MLFSVWPSLAVTLQHLHHNFKLHKDVGHDLENLPVVVGELIARDQELRTLMGLARQRNAGSFPCMLGSPAILCLCKKVRIEGLQDQSTLDHVILTEPAGSVVRHKLKGLLGPGQVP